MAGRKKDKSPRRMAPERQLVRRTSALIQEASTGNVAGNFKKLRKKEKRKGWVRVEEPKDYTKPGKVKASHGQVSTPKDVGIDCT